jgi:hypothetical protein
MAFLSVFVDGELLTSVNPSELEVLTIGVTGTRMDADFTTLDMSGGIYSERVIPSHLTWLNRLQINPGQQIVVSFGINGENFGSGKTIDERYPDEKDSPVERESLPLAEMLANLRGEKRIRKGYTFDLLADTGASFCGSTDDDTHGFGFSVIWNNFHPEQARFSLHSYTIDDLESRGSLKYFVCEYLTPGQSVHLKIYELEE